MPRTGRAQPILGFPSRSAAAAALAEQGHSVAEIAARLTDAAGETVTRKVVHELVSRARRARDGAPVQIRLSGPCYRALLAAGGARGLHARTLAARLLEVIAAEGMIEAVLDDGIATPDADGVGVDGEGGA